MDGISSSVGSGERTPRRCRGGQGAGKGPVGKAGVRNHPSEAKAAVIWLTCGTDKSVPFQNGGFVSKLGRHRRLEQGSPAFLSVLLKRSRKSGQLTVKV